MINMCHFLEIETMLRRTLIISVLALGLLAIPGCSSDEPDTAEGSTVALCTGCGQVKGGDVCCKADAEKCEKCDLAKGSPGCCNIPEGAEKVELCTKCGQLAGGDVCCKADAEKCEKCDLAKGSPGCCKLPAE